MCSITCPQSGGSILAVDDMPGAILLTMELPDEDRPPIVCALSAHDVGFLIEALIGHGQTAFTMQDEEEE